MRRGRVLVVEDDPAIATVVEETLRAEAYEVVCTDAWGPCAWRGSCTLMSSCSTTLCRAWTARRSADGCVLTAQLRPSPLS